MMDNTKEDTKFRLVAWDDSGKVKYGLMLRETEVTGHQEVESEGTG